MRAGSQIALLTSVAAMAAVVVLSNVLVQYPFAVRLGSLDLADLLTWGAFSYPIAFLVTDLTNRLRGPRSARRVVYVGFAVAVLLSVWVASPRIAIASGVAFLVGQLTDVGIFNALRVRAWWKAPVFSSFAGSFLDTLIFFSLAFAPAFVFLGAGDDFAVAGAPLLGAIALEAPRWVSWAIGDFGVKLLLAAIALLPYRLIVGYLLPMRSQPA